MTTIQIKRGLKANLPALLSGEFAFCTDTQELFLGTISNGNVLVSSGISSDADLNAAVQKIQSQGILDLYYIDLDRWGISNDFTNPDATTTGINNAITWAKTNGYRGAYLSEGTYSIQTGYWADQVNQTGGASPAIYGKYDTRIMGIRMVSDFMLEMHPQCILKANPDSAHFQTCLTLYRVNNVIIKGGQIIGDRDTHNYVGYSGYSDDNVSKAYGGHGYGLYLESVDGLKIYDTYIADWHGDGIIINGVLDYHFSRNIYMKNVTSTNNRRQGMSSGGYNLLFEDCTFSCSNGQDPESGVDLEGGIGNENVIFRRCKFTGNNSMGLIAYDCDVRVEDSNFDQVMGISAGARHVEVYNTTFTDENYRNFFAKYPNLMIAGHTYQLGERARMPDPARTWYGQSGFICTKAGTTAEFVQITVNSVPSASGNITITIAGTPFTVAVDPATDTTTSLVATKIKNGTYAGWTTYVTNNVVSFIPSTVFAATNPVFDGGTTGVTASLTHNFYYQNKNNYPPNQARGNYPPNVVAVGYGIQESQRNVTIVCGDSEWLREYYVYTYGGEGGLGGFTYQNLLPDVQRSNSTAYNVGDRIRFASSNNVSMQCIVAGTTGTSEPDASNTRLGESLVDGTVTWQMIDALEPVGPRQNNKSYSVGDYIWWDTKDSSIWECVTAGTTGSALPRLEDLPLGAQILPHYAYDVMTKVAWDSTQPQWTSDTILNATTTLNIGNTSWTCQAGNVGNKYPDITSVVSGTLVTDGTVVWKKIYDYLTSVRVEDSTFKNTGCVVGAQTVIAKNNIVTNNQFTLSGAHVISEGNIVDNRERDSGKTMSYTANSGTVRDDIIRNGSVQLNTLIDYRTPKKRIYERLTVENGLIYGDPVLYDSSISINRDLNTSTVFGNNQMRMVGGNFSAYVLPGVKIFGAWHASYEFLGTTFDIILSDATGTFLNNNSKMSEGNYYLLFRDCTFRVLPQVYDAQLFNQATSTANIKFLHNRFINLDTTKSIKVWIPTQDPTNTAVIDNYFDKNYYVVGNPAGNMNASYNRGGYSLVTSIESPVIPTAGDYALGTRIKNSLPSVGQPLGWVVTTAGQAFGSIRANSTTYNVGDWVKWSSGSNIYECIQAGTSSSTPPLAGAGVVTDGGVQWLYRGSTVATFVNEANL